MRTTQFIRNSTCSKESATMDDQLPIHIHDLLLLAASAWEGNIRAPGELREAGRHILVEGGPKALAETALLAMHCQSRMDGSLKRSMGVLRGRNLVAFIASCWNDLPSWKMNHDPALLPIKAAAPEAAQLVRLMRQLQAFARPEHFDADQVHSYSSARL
ncbi:hypothetical protein QTH97_34475 [Variovorax sp. J22R24]|uniref:hypothetical protein n=1 Tax=Variovorax gracilis TaxID=3053502 RepID=UPI00257880AF|nr:hypothetical protein [Variovorax sp. J22R24]MDM0110052.1 hypothetical protein [Variovorax sp. J22R24]